MFLRSAKTAFVTSMAMLVVLASLPQLVCCCNLSWGPIGLLNRSTEVCQSMCSQSTCDCCCEHKKDQARRQTTDEDATQPELSGKERVCTFHLVSPLPMSPDQPVVVLPLLAAAVSITPFVDVDPFDATRGVLDESRNNLCLTAASRCALIQSWCI